MSTKVITNILADAITSGRAICSEIAERIEAALLAEAVCRGARAGRIARKEIMAGRDGAFPRRKEEE